ncbi:hypothetical protein HYC85_002017 [Camellia sinensis]|uniref:Uncharacterized protein n=1 Tax=Camellia sinensis TaxID=4442 RepID=A0A7J7I9F2_CAMSI|nr:hypothetical protein HYC85_002017 [Camellia sinensis]
MVNSISTTTPSNLSIMLPHLNPQFRPSSFSSSSSSSSSSSLSISISISKPLRLALCRAAKQQSGPVKKPKKKKKVGGGGRSDGSSVLRLEDVEIEDDGDGFGPDSRTEEIEGSSQRYQPLPLPNPPAGFIVDDQGKVLMVSNKRIAIIVSDEEVEAILPTAAYALAKIHMHLLGEDFATQRMTYLNFVQDQNGQLQIVDDDLLEDPAVISAIDEETEFNALVEEEAALLESLLGKR